MTDTILVTTDGRVQTITISRPEKKNAITQAMYGKMADTINAYGSDDSLRALVVTGAGDMFTAGNDLMDFSTGDAHDTPPVIRFLEAIAACPKPILAAVNGPAIGVGLTMLLHFDLVFAGHSATFSAPFIQLGVVPEAASSMLLPAVVGMAVANDIFMTGRALTAEESLAFGLSSRLYADDVLIEETMKAAHGVAASAPTALRKSKDLVRFNRAAIAEHMRTEGAIFADQLKSADFAESVAAKMQKRAPVYK
ncbi:MAG: enoyl-CoA hydratase/isomerase family protein [Rhodobacteraceae bacterium]|nr:enoyl-CoA hydratase/isomerase family protein [Paracoccaceae bacterium]